MAGKKGMAGEGLGGPRLGAGRPVKRLTIRAGDSFFVTTADSDGRQVGLSEVWEIVEVTRTHILVHNSNGDRIRLVK